MRIRSLASAAIATFFALPAFAQSEFDNLRWHVFADPSNNQMIVVEETVQSNSKSITRIWHAPKGSAYLEGATVETTGSLDENSTLTFKVNATREKFEDIVVNEVLESDDLGLQFRAYELVRGIASAEEVHITEFGYLGKTNMLNSYASDGTMERVTPGMLTANDIFYSRLHQQRFFTKDNRSSLQFFVKQNQLSSMTIDGKEIPVQYNAAVQMLLFTYQGKKCTGAFYYDDQKMIFSIFSDGDRIGQYFGNFGELMID